MKYTIGMWGIGIVRIRSEEQGCDNGMATEETRALGCTGIS